MLSRSSRSALAGVLVLAAQAAAAAPTAAIPGDLLSSLRYPVSGVITPACSFTQGQRDIALTALADPATDTVRASTTDLNFSLSCNAPVRVAMHSDNGGLKFAGRGTSDADFTTLVDYRASLRLPGQGEVLRCASAAMTAKAKQCHAATDRPVGAGSGAIAVTVSASNDLLLAGRYQDRVTLVLTPMLGGEASN